MQQNHVAASVVHLMRRQPQWRTDLRSMSLGARRRTGNSAPLPRKTAGEELTNGIWDRWDPTCCTSRGDRDVRSEQSRELTPSHEVYMILRRKRRGITRLQG